MKILIFIAGVIAGAVLMYGALWYQAFREFEGAVCYASSRDISKCRSK